MLIQVNAKFLYLFDNMIDIINIFVIHIFYYEFQCQLT